MRVTKKLVAGAALMAALGIAISKLPAGWSRPIAAMPLNIRGAVMQQDQDVSKQVPLADVQIAADGGQAMSGGVSDSSGFFTIPLRRGSKPGEKVLLKLRHPDYQPLDVEATVGDQIFVARMIPVRRTGEHPSPDVPVGSISVRYSMETSTSINIGSAAKTFQVPNIGNVPCDAQGPCSPDLKWKASVATATLDAGEGKEFRNGRVSCIAGPCPFAAIDTDSFSHPARRIDVSVRNWSDTTTFLLEAEVYRQQVVDSVRQTYPVIIGQAMNFTLPAAAEGPSIEAKIDGSTIVFPLGLTPEFSWADCSVRTDEDQTRVFWCALRPGYRFP